MQDTHRGSGRSDLAATIATLSAQVRALTDTITDSRPRVSYRPDAAGRLVDVSPSTIRRMVRDGELRKVPHMGTAVVIPHTELVRVFGHVDLDQLAQRRAS